MDIEKSFDTIDDVINQHADTQQRNIPEERVINVDTSQDEAKKKRKFSLKNKKLAVGVGVFGAVVGVGIMTALLTKEDKPLPPELAGPTQQTPAENSSPEKTEPEEDKEDIVSVDLGATDEGQKDGKPSADMSDSESTTQTKKDATVSIPSTPQQQPNLDTSQKSSTPQNVASGDDEVQRLRKELEQVRAELAKARAEANQARAQAAVAKAKATTQKSAQPNDTGAAQASDSAQAESAPKTASKTKLLKDGIVINENGVDRVYAIGEKTPYGVLSSVDFKEGTFVTENGQWKTQ